MTGYASWDMQKALYDALTGDATLTGLITGVYDHVEQETAFPYVTIGESSINAFDTKDTDGMEHILTINSWSRKRGRKEIKQIHAEIYRILQNQNISISNQHIILIQFDFEEIYLDPDGLTYHGVLRFRCLTQSN
ncbi:MAG: DUF3168 domain-containing protein [Rickettsiales bacterium]|nr:DUF3168 domain-containing protein [Pseudomonadota bacterium]MDA0966883.1 DUF3168 domain-containing protein [Pseudomonadota bacterium]MDG4543558.1 DUF3168 domain-containing protein [Rickettsiales bacterium]MDG4545706.1 DUF3168 domain-containing protein [Rickettsiales bacterium]MDG4547521.1 DUF3168 domain-containing protein [Rickettsiales bacterium]